MLRHVLPNLDQGRGNDLTHALAGERRIELAPDGRATFAIALDGCEDRAFRVRQCVVDGLLSQCQLLDRFEVLPLGEVIGLGSGGSGSEVGENERSIAFG
jgi:hypothetical protein